MTIYIGGNVGTSPSSTIESISAPGGDIDFTSTGATVVITSSDANDTINFEAAMGAGLPADDTVSVVQGSADSTKQIRFEVDGLTTGTVRVITPPDKDITLDDVGDERDPTAHAGEHVDGTDDIQDATAAQKGVATAAQITKLDAIEALADVTDAANVASAGGILSGDTAGGDLGGTYPNPTVDDGADSTAIHDDTASEISAVTEKTTPVGADLLLIEDSAAGNAKKRLQLDNLPDRPSANFSSYGSAYTTGAPAAGGGTISENIETGDIAGLGVNHTNVIRIQITPSTDCDSYTVEFFKADSHTGAKNFTLLNVTTSAAGAVAIEVQKDMTFVDADASSELHVKITNNDATTTPTFLIEIEGETGS